MLFNKSAKYKYFFSVFLTLRCNFNCSYCIQKMSDFDYNKEVDGEKWIKFLTDKVRNKCLELIGGEPTLHKDFKSIIEATHKLYLLTVTTNLGTELFANMDKFINWAGNKKVKWNTSFHPGNMACDEYIDRIKRMQKAGLSVGQVASPNLEILNPYRKKLEDADIGFRTQVFTGFINGELRPNKEEMDKQDPKLTGIMFDWERYKDAFSCRKKRKMLCRSKRFLIAPNGNLHKCHYHLYSNGKNFGNVFNKYTYTDKFFECDDYGFCNPCDYPDVEFRELKR